MLAQWAAIIALRDLFEFCDWIDYSYSREYDEKTYDESILASGNEKRIKADELMKLYEGLSSKDKKLESVLKESPFGRIVALGDNRIITQPIAKPAPL